MHYIEEFRGIRRDSESQNKQIFGSFPICKGKKGLISEAFRLAKNTILIFGNPSSTVPGAIKSSLCRGIYIEHIAAKEPISARNMDFSNYTFLKSTNTDYNTGFLVFDRNILLIQNLKNNTLTYAIDDDQTIATAVGKFNKYKTHLTPIKSTDC